MAYLLVLSLLAATFVIADNSLDPDQDSCVLWKVYFEKSKWMTNKVWKITQYAKSLDSEFL